MDEKEKLLLSFLLQQNSTNVFGDYTSLQLPNFDQNNLYKPDNASLNFSGTNQPDIDGYPEWKSFFEETNAQVGKDVNKYNALLKKLELRPDININGIEGFSDMSFEQKNNAITGAIKKADRNIVNNFAAWHNLGAVGNASSAIYSLINAHKAKGGNTSNTNGVDLSKTDVQGFDAQKFGNYATIAGSVSDVARSFLNPKQEYSGPKGGLTKGIDTAYDTASDFVSGLGPYGAIIGGAMKVGGFVSQALSAAGIGTDGLTTTDAILGSSFFSLTPLGLANSIGASKLDTFTEDKLATSLVGGSYAGSMKDFAEAAQLSGKSVGLLSSKGKFNRKIADANQQQRIMSGIAEDAANATALTQSMAAINENKEALNLAGGYQQAIHSGKEGLVIPDRDETGEESEKFAHYLNSLPEEQQDSTYYRVKSYWEYNGKPKDFQEAVNKGMFVLQDGKWHAYTIAVNPKTQEMEFMKLPNHPTIYKELDWYNSDDGAEFRSQYVLDQSDPYWKYLLRNDNKTKADSDVQKFADGGQQNKTASTYTTIAAANIKFPHIDENEQDTDSDVQKFADGGQVNVIPEGSLHARRHNMDVENITRKGIPVVSETEDGGIEQQAEIERGEIIFRLDITKRLEDLCETFYSEKSSDEDKDKSALLAGQILVQEVLFNTIDNTNLIKQTTI